MYKIHQIIVYTALFVAIDNVHYAQSKKEQIDALNNTIDSLKRQFILDSTNHFAERNNLIGQISALRKDFNEQNTLLTDTELKVRQQALTIKHLNDSLSHFFKSFANSKEGIYAGAYFSNISEDLRERFSEITMKYPPKELGNEDQINYSVLKSAILYRENNHINALVVTLDKEHFALDEVQEESLNRLTLHFHILDCSNPFNINEKYHWKSIVDSCYVDHDNQMIDVQFTDLNADGNVEVWCVNELYCKGGVDPNNLLIFKYENFKHCTLQSMTNIVWNTMDEESVIDDSFLISNDYNVILLDECFKNNDPAIIAFAKYLRKKNVFGEEGPYFYGNGSDERHYTPLFWSSFDN